MPTSGIKIGRIFGIPIYLHATWFIVFALITFSLAKQFAYLHATWSEPQHWAAGVATSLLFFGSVLLHELGHSVIALRYRIPVVSITLFIFGGVARIGREPDSARKEFNIAIAGPLVSFGLAGIFTLISNPHVFGEGGMPDAMAGWLARINLMLGAFNLVPGFPLDGGRIFRALVWWRTHDFARATRLASRIGQFIAYGLIVLGIWRSLTAGLMAGLWFVFIGWFLLNAAQESMSQVAIRDALAGLRAADIMTQELPTIPGHLTLDEYFQELLRTGRRCHLVISDGRMAGLMSVHALNRVPREDWPVTSVQAAMIPRDLVHLAAPDDPLLGLLERMQSEDVNQMPIVSDGRVVGIVTRDSILRVIQTRLEIGSLAGSH